MSRKSISQQQTADTKIHATARDTQILATVADTFAHVVAVADTFADTDTFAVAIAIAAVACRQFP